MKLNFRPGSLRPRTLFWLALVGICLISSISYTITLACGWGGVSSAHASAHPHVCIYLSSNGQNCIPFKIKRQKCTQITGTQTPTPTATSDGQTPTPTATSDGQTPTPTTTSDEQTPALIVIPCISATTVVPVVTPSTTPTSSTQVPTLTATPCISPITASQASQALMPPCDTSVSGAPTPVPTPDTSSSVVPTPVPTPDTSSSVVPTPVPTPATSSSGNDPQAQAAQAVFTQINQERAGAGLPPLQWSTQLVQSAHNHNLVMQQANQLSHQLPNEADLGTRISNTGITWTQAAENIAESSGNTTDTPEVIATNLNQGMFNEQPPDDGHRTNILSTNTLIGIDVIVDTQHNIVWLTEDFARS